MCIPSNYLCSRGFPGDFRSKNNNHRNRNIDSVTPATIRVHNLMDTRLAQGRLAEEVRVRLAEESANDV